jgi:zinc/manganese transport system permease protein
MGFEALFVEPFVEFGFLRRALVACLALSLGSAPLGALLMLRRMSLVGDAMAHALLPGAAIGYALAGFSLVAIGGGGFVAALLVALLAGWAARATPQREDASFAAFYLIALAAGVMIIAARGSAVDLMRLLFGSVLAVDDASLLLIAGVASLTLLVLAAIYRPLVAEIVDPAFLRVAGGRGGAIHVVFLVLVVANLVAAFQTLGTLMAVGLMMLPAVAARFWAAELPGIAAVAAAIGAASGLAGLLISYHLGLPSGPAIVLSAGACYLFSLFAGRRDSLLARQLALHRHQAA